MNSLDIQRLSYPRVSEIIAKQNSDEYRSVSLEVLANASERGTRVHGYCTSYITGLYAGDVEEEYRPYVDAFIEWYKSNVHTVFFTQDRLYDDVARFTGEFDLLCCLSDGSIALIDIKCVWKASKTWPVQLAAYHHLCQINGYPVTQRFYNLHLKTKKAPKWEMKEGEKVLVSPPQVETLLIQHDNITSYWDIFSSALECYKYFHEKENEHASI